MTRFLLNTRYLILIPIVGLALAAAFFFVFGGIGLGRLLLEYLAHALGPAEATAAEGQSSIIFQVVEYVHTFLIGTVLYITAVGLYQLFVHEIPFPRWLKIDSTEELETNLIGVTVVVLAVNFMGAVLVRGTDNLIQYGGGIALPIAALGLFIGLRSWSGKINREGEGRAEGPKAAAAGESSSQAASGEK
jgi:uncharacterized membrane protein YqhA